MKTIDIVQRDNFSIAHRAHNATCQRQRKDLLLPLFSSLLLPPSAISPHEGDDLFINVSTCLAILDKSDIRYLQFVN